MSATIARFTKKHYEALAEMVRNFVAITDADREKIARQMAEQFAATQPSFNRARFLAACRGISITPNPYDVAIEKQRQIVREFEQVHAIESGNSSLNDLNTAVVRLNAMHNGRYATKEECERLDRETSLSGFAR